MKTATLLFIALFCCIRMQAQTAPAAPSVMIIPFDPNMYFSDADEQLAKYNDKSIKEIRTMFSYGVNLNVNAKIISHYQTRPLLTDTAQNAREDLNLIYGNLSYFKDKAMPVKETTEKTTEKNKTENAEAKKTFPFKKKNEESDAQVTSKLKEPARQHEYINVKILNSKMLTYLNQRYGTELFVFINQFDLVTNYEHCLDRATNTFERDIRVHFSIFDATGKQVAGDVAIVHFPSNSNDIMEIIRNNLPVIAEYLAANLPKKVKSEMEIPDGMQRNDVMEFEGN